MAALDGAPVSRTTAFAQETMLAHSVIIRITAEKIPVETMVNASLRWTDSNVSVIKGTQATTVKMTSTNASKTRTFAKMEERVLTVMDRLTANVPLVTMANCAALR